MIPNWMNFTVSTQHWGAGKKRLTSWNQTRAQFPDCVKRRIPEQKSKVTAGDYLLVDANNPI